MAQREQRPDDLIFAREADEDQPFYGMINSNEPNNPNQKKEKHHGKKATCTTDSKCDRYS